MGIIVSESFYSGYPATLSSGKHHASSFPQNITVFPSFEAEAVISFYERSFVVTYPYDGTPEGNGLGAIFDQEDRQRRFDAISGFDDYDDDRNPPSRLQLLTFVLGAVMVLSVFMFGTVG